VKGWYHPAGPADVPVEVAGWVEPVAMCLRSLDVDAAKAGWGR